MVTENRLFVCCRPMVACLAAATVIGCGPEPKGDGSPDPEDATVSIEVGFDAQVGERPFSCGTEYADLGTSNSAVTPTDLRLFLHDVRLVDAAGEEVVLTVTNDDAFQIDGTVLLDFEDGTGPCSNGTPATHTRVRGTAPAGDYTGVRFTLGVPFVQNHQNPAVATPPLNDTTMFWSWQGGYKFLRLEQTTAGMPTGFLVHVGSTGCDGDPATGGVTSCGAPNRASVALDGFDPTSQNVVVDVAALLEGNNLETDAGGAPGCMAGPADPECAPLFERLGLPFGDTAASPQSFFRAP